MSSISAKTVTSKWISDWYLCVINEYKPSDKHCVRYGKREHHADVKRVECTWASVLSCCLCGHIVISRSHPLSASPYPVFSNINYLLYSHIDYDTPHTMYLAFFKCKSDRSEMLMAANVTLVVFRFTFTCFSWSCIFKTLIFNQLISFCFNLSKCVLDVCQTSLPYIFFLLKM